MIDREILKAFVFIFVGIGLIILGLYILNTPGRIEEPINIMNTFA